MRSYFVDYMYVKHFYERWVRHNYKMENLKSERLSSTSVRNKCLPRKFMKTSWKPMGSSLLLIEQCKMGSRV